MKMRLEFPEMAVSAPGRWKQFTYKLALALLAAAAIGWSAQGTQFNFMELLLGRENMGKFLLHMFPPDFSGVLRYLKAMYSTILVALLGTAIGIAVSLPLGMMAAKNISPHPVVYQCARLVLNLFRSINEMIFALIFVSAVGLGPFPGVLALAVHSAGKLGKFYAEAMENIDPGPAEALESTGAGRLKTFRFSVWPQMFPEFITYSLYQWESNVRSATILGLVGAGGIGLELISAMRMFQYPQTSTILLIIFATVMLVDFLSSRIRAKII